jgi:hypothetical protein
LVVAAGLRSGVWSARALFSYAALVAALALAPGALASGFVPDPDPNASQNEPQPDAYQSAPAAAPAGTATQTQTQTPAPLLPTVTVPQAKPAEHTAPSRVQPSVVATPAQAAVAPTEVPAVRSTPSRTEAHIVIPTVTSVTHKQRSRAARSAHRQRHVVAHRTRAAIPVTPIRFANSALDLRWPAAFASSAAVDIARPRHVPPGVALAVAAVVLLSGSFLAVAARQVREQVTP